jgi:hypothetical protein
VHTLLQAPTVASDQIPRFFAQVDLVWKKMKSQYDARAVAELNKELRYIVFFSGDSAALNASRPAMLE